ncbi:MAG TPA: GntR family transcriptional regulator [Pelomicrobium sp.]|nr:GntR family transcriptional regulator [Pelomicrobium sp.]
MVTASKRRSLHAVAGATSLRPLADQAYERIKHDILMCAIAPGGEVSEAQLAARYGFGKAPVRAALARLSHEHLVKSSPRRGYTVSPVTLRDIEDVFELRLLLEPATARLAAGRVDARRLKALDEVCRAGYTPDDPESRLRFLNANREFHVAVALATANQRLANASAQLLDEMTRMLLLGLGLRNRSLEMQHEHRSLIKALANGDGAAAERICREQIEAAREMVLRAVVSSPALMRAPISMET